MTEIGREWFPAVPRSDYERNYIWRANRELNIPTPFWIGGSTDYLLSDPFGYEHYQTNNSGE